MIKPPRAHATIVAYLALFVALGGVAWAAGLPRNSVSTKQLRANAVTSSKVRNGTLSLVDIAPATRRVLRGQRGATGPPGATGTSGLGGPRGLAAWEPIPSGTTVTGALSRTEKLVANEVVVGSVSLPALAPIPLTDATVNAAAPVILQQAPFLGDADPACTGDSETPTAPPGKVCVYLRDTLPNIANGSFSASSFFGDASQAERTGFVYTYTATGSGGQVVIRFGWAYTAP